MKSATRQKGLGSLFINGSLFLLVFLWTIPTLGIFVSSFRNRGDISNSGWWNVLPHREWQSTRELDPKAEGLDPNEVMEIEGATGTFKEFREGVETPSGMRITWIGNKRLGRIEVQERVWTVAWDFSFDNYIQVWGGKDFEFTKADGTVEVVPGDDMSRAFLNSFAVTIPSTVIPILIAAFAAYAFAWMKFPGRRWLFILVVALLVVPLQIALVPILRDYKKLELNGTFLAIWMEHTGLGLALATYLLYNYISGLPREAL